MLTPPSLPAPRCPALLVVGDSSPAVDAVVRRNHPLVSVLNSTVQMWLAFGQMAQTRASPWLLPALFAWYQVLCLFSQAPAPASLPPIGVFRWACLPLGLLANRLSSYLGIRSVQTWLVPDCLARQRGPWGEGLRQGFLGHFIP